MGLVLGANLGNGLLAVLTTAKSAPEVRQVPLGNFVFKAIGVLVAAPLASLWLREVRPYVRDPATIVVLLHLVFNLIVAVLFIGFTAGGRALGRALVAQARQDHGGRPAASPRSVGAGHAFAGDLVRRARGAAPGRRGRDHAAGHAVGDQEQRPALGARNCASSTTTSTNSIRRSSTT